MTIETPTERAELYAFSAHSEGETVLAQLDVSKLKITLTDTPKPLPDVSGLSFGMNFTDHIAITTFHPATGWSVPEIKPYAPLALDPASTCFQYGCNIYEGTKAYLGPDGQPRLFRPKMNMRRLERSMARLALPPIDGDAVLELIKRFVQIEKRWIPTLSGYSLYLRPTVIGTRPALGLAAPDHVVLYILASPSGPYFPRPVSLLAVGDMVRAWPGGTGANKIGGNYSPTFLAQRHAATQGYDQVLWLFGAEKAVTEAGAMNVFVVLKREDGNGLDVLTPPLDGTILPGVTRLSCLQLAADPTFHASIGAASTSTGTLINKGMPLHPFERSFTITDLEHWSATGALLEFFCVGTAVIILAAHEIGFEGRIVARAPRYSKDSNGLGPVASALRTKLLAVQEGREEYQGWGVVCE